MNMINTTNYKIKQHTLQSYPIVVEMGESMGNYILHFYNNKDSLYLLDPRSIIVKYFYIIVPITYGRYARIDHITQELLSVANYYKFTQDEVDGIFQQLINLKVL